MVAALICRGGYSSGLQDSKSRNTQLNGLTKGSAFFIIFPQEYIRVLGILILAANLIFSFGGAG